MRALVWFLTAITVSLFAATLIAYPAYQWIDPTGSWSLDALSPGVHALHANWRIDKIASRLFNLFLLLSIFAVLRHLQLRGRSAWGWQVTRSLGARQFAIGLGLGVVSMLMVSLAMVALGVRPLDPAADMSEFMRALGAGIGSGLVVGLLEETLFRGLIQGAVTRNHSRTAPGIIAVAILFAGVHFLSSVHIAHADVTPDSGRVLMRGMLSSFLHPAEMLDSFCALLGVGLLTGLARAWTGNILFAAGLHAGWVLVMRMTVGLTLLPAPADRSWLLSSHDGYTGWLVFVFTVVFLLLTPALRKPFQRWLKVTESAN
jgi:membrane protease YdiL (CAAX protease family)